MAASSDSMRRAGTAACEPAEEKAVLVQAPAQLLSSAAVRLRLAPSQGQHGPSVLKTRENPGIAFSSFVGTGCVNELLVLVKETRVALAFCWVSLSVRFL